MKPNHHRLKRLVWGALALEMIASPILFLMADGPPKIIVAGVWFAILALTMIVAAIIAVSTSNR